jgi:Icc protein
MSRHVTQRLLQISDPHLFADPEGDLLGQRTRLTLEGVLNLAGAKFGAADRVLLTGDLTQDASPAAYRYLAERCGRLGLPCHALPGNHDDPQEMARSLGAGPIDMPHAVDCDPWRLVLLDSTLAGKRGGIWPRTRCAAWPRPWPPGPRRRPCWPCTISQCQWAVPGWMRSA